jgi:DNA-binding protein YbaB
LLTLIAGNIFPGTGKCEIKTPAEVAVCNLAEYIVTTEGGGEVLFQFEEFGRIIGDLTRVKEALRNLRIEVTEGPISLALDGLQEVVRVKIKPESGLNVAQLENKIATCFNKGVAESRMAAKTEIERITGWNIPSFPGLI